MEHWGGFLEIAHALAKVDEEASLRSAVGRAYYALFGTARDYLEEQQYPFKGTGEDHTLVWTYLRRRKKRELVRVADEGERLRSFRRWADYDLMSRARLRDDVHAQLGRVETVMGLLHAEFSRSD